MTKPADPYAPPPRHRDSSGALVRFVILAALLAAGAWGYMEFLGDEQSASAPAEVQEQSLAAGETLAAPAQTDETAPAG